MNCSSKDLNKGEFDTDKHSVVFVTSDSLLAYDDYSIAMLTDIRQ